MMLTPQFGSLGRFLMALFAWCFLCAATLADGLIFQLPADGTWVRYTAEAKGVMVLKHRSHSHAPVEQRLSKTSTFLLSSVGTVTRNDQTCRWIELKSECKDEGAYPKLILKMLIPEERLCRGEDPLSHSTLTFFDPKPVDAKKAPAVESYIDEGFNRIQYEIDRFRLQFPRPLENAKSLPRETVETDADKFEDCEILTGTSQYDGPLLGQSRNVFKATYRLAVHPKSPFGVVSMHIEAEAREIHEDSVSTLRIQETLKLTESGVGAISALPNKREKQPND